ncbi:hypothetical protein [Stieleria mannarensis]|uniref:hypothetical protein n=1 Tax=Stieleria mannarensis TaxID=2755585 RepID=UPI0015FEC842|nr:hypothetical protein [Rhodopirellula sp. JC639]
MTNSQRLATVRAHLQHWLAANVTPSAAETVGEPTSEGNEQIASQDGGESDGDASAPAERSSEADPTCEADRDDVDAAKIGSESILIRDGFYAGRTFHATAGDQTYRATWFMEPDELKIHGAGGALVASFQGDQIGAEIPVVETTVLEEQDDSQSHESDTVSIPMTAAEQESATDLDSDQDGQLPQAA